MFAWCGLLISPIIAEMSIYKKVYITKQEDRGIRPSYEFQAVKKFMLVWCFPYILVFEHLVPN